MSEEKHNLVYKILGRRKLPNDANNLDYVDVDWSLADGKMIEDFETRPLTHPPHIEYKRVKVGERKIIKDNIAVHDGAPDSYIMKLLDEKREKLATALGIKP